MQNYQDDKNEMKGMNTSFEHPHASMKVYCVNVQILS